MPPQKPHWAHTALANKLKEQNTPKPPPKKGDPRPVPEVGTIFLFDPEARKAIDSIIREEVWPSVKEGLAGSRVKIYEGSKALEKVHDLRKPVSTRQLLFLLDDPERPLLSPGSPSWYIRCTVDVTQFDYMAQFELLLTLPLETNWENIVLLLSKKSLSGNSPSLSMEDDAYTLSFSWGQGGGYLSDNTFEKIITDSVRKHLSIIEAADGFEGRPDADNFNALCAAIIEMYGDDY